jgi:hypothetical protein
MSSICKYCQKVELTFDNAHKSKSGRLIPLDKQSGLPHQCSESPYAQKQQQQQNTIQTSDYQQQPEQPADYITEIRAMHTLAHVKLDRIIDEIQRLEDKTDRIARLVYALTSGEQSQVSDGTLLINR